MIHPKTLTTLKSVLCANSEDRFTFAIPKQTKIILKSDHDAMIKELIETLEEGINGHKLFLLLEDLKKND